MKKQNKLKIINDPIYGFITIPSELIFDLIEHPYFQRLRRITQMGLSHLVYPGAQHTRFQHALGCLYLMQKALQTLKFKGIEITKDEEEATLIAILLHDIGHGPFSHALENSLIEGLNHENLSLEFMENLNKTFEGKLTLAIKIFKGDYSKMFLTQLIAGQLDIDRLDYLKRDSFYTGVAEGNINSDRLITMINVRDNQLVIEEKGIYSVEKFLLARRLMYWQVYLHKTSLGAELILIKILKRAKELIQQGQKFESNSALSFFLNHNISYDNFNVQILEFYSQLDDYDIITAIKQWQSHPDYILSSLCKMLINRKLFKVKLKNKAFKTKKTEVIKHSIKKQFNITSAETDYFFFEGTTSNQAYNYDYQKIMILFKNNKTKEVSQVSDQLNLKTLAQPVVKFYICYPKDLV
ncbi:HD domain-containing protein [Mesohalobacter halotolerans]|uniref:HD domain-containing protein n=1 Tax=Mesohalobacter halotolerans TaxID=1883405 RepID=A0A4V6AMF6_9FLAO|nr:HD domain-containing protein [Mesohalobacter halotolerans]MBS3738619.1 HD domain-containing protein [Psychroflexus sp.]NBC56918.1 HD domain-containing protein [Bacteroidota bacterium]TKS56005.1 HD domain-containing protein [Mesohalobacter halotolerans]